MMKALKVFFSIFFTFSLIFSLTACNKKEETKGSIEETISEPSIKEQIYKLAKEAGYSGTYEEWLASIRGDEVELSVNGTILEWKYKSETTYKSLIDLNTLKGLDGRKIELSCNEVAIIYRYEGDKDYQELIKLEALKGNQGENGKSAYELACDLGFKGDINEWLLSLKGKDGKEIEFKLGDKAILWHYVGDETWKDLVPLESLKGEKGDKGSNGLSAYELYKARNPQYKGSEIDWLNDLVNGNLGNKLTYMVFFDPQNGEFYPEQIVYKYDKLEKPLDPVKEGYKFLGWFINDELWNFSGNVVTSEMVLVAKWEKIETKVTYTMSDLEVVYDNLEHSLEINEELAPGLNVTYFNNTHKEVGVYEVLAIIEGDNFKTQTLKANLTIKESGTYEVSEEFNHAFSQMNYSYKINNDLEYGFDNGNSYVMLEGVKFLNVLENDTVKCYFTLEGFNYYSLPFEDSYVEAKAVPLYKYRKSAFFLKDDYYTLDYLNINRFGQSLFRTKQINFIDAKIYLKEQLGDKIIVTDDKGEVYELTFFNYNKTVIKALPDSYHYGVEDPAINLAVKDVSNYQYENKLVRVKGYCTYVHSKILYLNDGEDMVLVHLGETGYDTFKPEVGKSYEIFGEVKKRNYILMLRNVRDIKEIPDKFSISNYAMDYLDTEKLVSALGRKNVQLNRFYLTESTGVNKNDDIIITLKDALGTEIDLAIADDEDVLYRQKVLALLKTLKVGSALEVQNLFLDTYKDGYPLFYASPNTVFKVLNLEPEILGVESEKDDYSYPLNTQVDVILNDIKLLGIYSDNSRIPLSKETYSITPINFKPDTYGSYLFQLIIDDFFEPIEFYVNISGTSFKEMKSAPLYLDYYEKGGDIENMARFLPSIGSPKVLIMPIEFEGYPFRSDIKSYLNTAFFGTSEETGWESLSSYYSKSSYNKLNIKGTVLDVYKTGHTVKEYGALVDKYSRDVDLYNEDIIKNNGTTDLPYPHMPMFNYGKDILNINDSQINYDEYDLDNDGHLDAVYFVYSCPYKTDNVTDLWAYTTAEADYGTPNDNKLLGFYVSMSVVFFDEIYHPGIDYKINCETVIHETGHLLGLSDYYDTNRNNGDTNGVGNNDMMDGNFGDHNPFSKFYYGWVNPYINFGKTETYHLKSFTETGDCIVIPKVLDGTYLTEYYTIELYTPTGLYEKTATDTSKGAMLQPGVRILHVDSTFNDYDKVHHPFTFYKYNNENLDHMLVRVVEADGDNSIPDGNNLVYSDLFHNADTLVGERWYDGTLCKFIISVNNLTDTSVDITINYF